MKALRTGDSGQSLQPLIAKGQYSWTASGALVLVLAPAGHDAGLYETIQTFFARVVPGAGTLTTVLAWDQPRFGATSLTIAFGNIITNPAALRVIDSTGAAAITLTATPAGVTGSPLIEVACSAIRITTAPS